MSAKISGMVWDLDLCQRDLLVLLAITDHANHEGVMWPSVALLAWMTGYSQRTVLRTLDSLVRRGILQRRARPGRETIYATNFDAATALGWRYLRYTGEMLQDDPQGVFDEIRAVLAAQAGD